MNFNKKIYINFINKFYLYILFINKKIVRKTKFQEKLK